MKPFKLTMNILTPFSCNYPITLDAILSAAIFRQCGAKEKETIPLIPLAREDGIFRASSLHYNRQQYSHENIHRVMNLLGESDLSVEAFAPNRKRGNGYMMVDKKRGDYKTNMDSYSGIEAQQIYFWGLGDPDAVVTLIQNYIPGIGKRSNAGAGQIDSLQADVIAEDRSWLTQAGLPARPLPKALWERLSPLRLQTMPMAVDVPYWSAEQVDAVFPTQAITYR